MEVLRKFVFILYNALLFLPLAFTKVVSYPKDIQEKG